MTAAIRSTSNRTATRTVRQHGRPAVRVGRAGRPAARPMCRAHVDQVDATPAARRTGRPSEATYRRRRAIVGTILAVFVAVGLVVAHDVLAGSGGVPASAAAGRPAHDNTGIGTANSTVVARPGDTLWSIADEHRGDISISRYVDTLVDLNGGASIEAGQQIVLP